MSVRVAPLLLFIVGAPLVLACDDTSAADEGSTPGGVLWDHEWTFQSTNVELRDGSTVPFPTDYALLERIRWGMGGGGGAPPVGDVLEGARTIFEVDGRVLVQPDGFDEPAYFGTNYRVIDHELLRASVRKTIWFKYEYDFDPSSGTLLISPEEQAASVWMGFVLDIVQATLFSGALDSAAARVATFLFEDPRVKEALDQFVYDLVRGQLDRVPVSDPDDVTDWLIAVLKRSGLVPEATPDAVLRAVISPIVDDLLPLDRDNLAERLVDLIAGSDLGAAITEERVEAVFRFVLYREMLDIGQHLRNVRRIDMVLQVNDPE